MPDWVVRAQFGHISPAMMAVYSYVRRKALDEAAKGLKPDHAMSWRAAARSLGRAPVQDREVTSHVTSQVTPSSFGPGVRVRVERYVKLLTRHDGQSVTEMLFPGDSCLIDSSVPHQLVEAHGNPYERRAKLIVVRRSHADADGEV